MKKRDKITLLETGGLFKLTYKEKGFGTKRYTDMFGRVKRVTNNGTKSQMYVKIENDTLAFHRGVDEHGNSMIEHIGTHELNYLGLLNITYIEDVQKIKD